MAKPKAIVRTIKRGRDSKTGRFIPIAEAQKRKATTEVETYKVSTSKAKKKQV